MIRLTITKTRQMFAETVNRVHYRGDRVLVQKRGKTVVAIISPEDFELLEELENRRDAEDLRAALTAARRKKTVAWDDLKSELAL